jgi:hypothetical protein
VIANSYKLISRKRWHRHSFLEPLYSENPTALPVRINSTILYEGQPGSLRQCGRGNERCRKSNSDLYNHDVSINGSVIVVRYKTEAQFSQYQLLKDDICHEWTTYIMSEGESR